MSSHAPGLDLKVSASIDAWKRKLLDLTKRNRLLNFKVNRVSTVTVMDEQPAEVFRRLYIAEAGMRFRAVPDKEEQPTVDLWDDTAADPVSSAEFKRYDTAALDDRFVDDWLQTNATKDNLDRSLRRLEEQARLTIEEQGVNTLFLTLGMLHYKDEDSADEVYRAPLVLLPVELTRASARAGYELHAADDEPLVNPALAEQLRMQQVTLPQLPEAGALGDDFDLQNVFAATVLAIVGHAGWKVTNDIYLAQLSFQKFVMFKDLEKHADAIGGHRLIRQLVGRTGDHVVGLPEEIRQLELDQAFPPESTFQVVDADSSQLRAIAACQRGYDLVVEGPPGTGKSQTITNLIAQTLAAGKSVLFVAEKMAALSVVHRRLVNAGLGEFCLELHSSKQNKRAVMADLANTINASLVDVAHDAAAAERLPEVRGTLRDYVQALHEPFGMLGLTPFQGYGELARVRHAKSVTMHRPVDEVTRQELAQTLRDVRDLAASATEVGVIAAHPWRDSTRTALYTEDDLEQVAATADAMLDEVDRAIQLAAQVSTTLGLPPISGPAEARQAAEIASLIGRSPGAPLAVLQSDAWNEAPPSATRIVQAGRDYARLKSRLLTWFTPEVLEQEHARDIDYVEAKRSGIIGFLAPLDARYRAITKRWQEYRLPSYTKSMLEQAQHMRSVDSFRAARTQLGALSKEARELFGAHWRETESDWSALEQYSAWVVEFRRAVRERKLSDRTIEVAAQPRPDVSSAEQLLAAVSAYQHKLAELGELIGWPEAYLREEPFAQVATRLQQLRDKVQLGPSWAAFERNRQAVAAGHAAGLLPHAMSGAIPFDTLAEVFERAFYMKWLQLAVQTRPSLERFQSLTHEQRVLEFQQLDQQVLRENRLLLTRQLRNQAQERLRAEDVKRAMPFLQQQMTRQRAISPLRQIMARAGDAVRALKPCFMMSPLTVAQLLQGDRPSFDLIIFDEASQLPPEDAIGAIARGQQLVVVGDPKQLPPTNFFAITTGQIQPQFDEDGNPMYDDAESILEQFMGAGVPMSRLKWHYRSAHESLITFSNVHFYDAELYTFPCIDRPCAAVQFEFVADGQYEGKGLNPPETMRVADAIVLFAKEQLARPEAERLSLGVGTFNLRQQIAIQDELERRRRADPSIDEFFRLDTFEPFFVKNLENIQGDERDVIFLSVTYGPGADRRIRYNFGPLNSQNGWRRLNVLVTRARQQLRVFSSMHGEDINPAAAQSQGPQLLRDFLVYAEHGRLDSPVISALANAESPFEREVCAELQKRGFHVVSQVGSAGYRVDLGVLDPDHEGRFLCGIECDGVDYHTAETARDRDRLRQQVLENRGWVIHRVWSTDWFRDRAGQIDRLVRLIEADRARPREEPAPAKPDDVEPITVPSAPSEETRPYQRPTAQPYVTAQGEGQYAGQDILAVPDPQLAEALMSVVDVEAPVHVTDAYTRVAAFWDKRLGARIEKRIEAAAKRVEKAGLMRRRGDFLWSGTNRVTVRSRAGLNTQPDRIAPEEYDQAIRLILAEGHSFPRQTLINEVRALLGFSRTGTHLQQAISDAIDRLMTANVLGEGSAGVCLRGRND